MDTFLPSDYTMPEGNYYKFQDGENTFRVLSSAIIGWSYWTNDNKPVRTKQYPQSTPNIRIADDGKPEKPKHFWCFVVYNYNSKSVQIAEITQKSIQAGINALVKNAKWGDPKKYDITVTKSGSGLKTEYAVMPNPHSEIPEDAVKFYEETKIDLEALYAGADPFDPNWTADAVPFP